MTLTRTIVFDLDGTLVDTAPDLIAALNFVLDREGLPPVPLQSARNMIGAGARKLIERGLEPVASTPEAFARFIREDRAASEQIVKESGLQPQ